MYGSLTALTGLFQLGYFHVTEEPIQDADSGRLQLSQDFPSASRGHHREP